jgi:hypothetical protein
MLLAAAVVLSSHQTIAMFMIGWVSLALLFIGIHDAWDTVTWSAAQTGEQNPPRSSAVDQ